MAALLSLYFTCASLPVEKITACNVAVKACYSALSPQAKASKVMTYEACKQHLE